MLVISCHADTGFYEHSLERRPEGTFFGHLDNFAGVYAVMKAYFSGKLDKDYLRVELTYGEEEDFEGAKEVLRTLRRHDVVIVVDVTGTRTSKEVVIEKCKDEQLRLFLEEVLDGLPYELHKGCPDPITDEDEVDAYGEKLRRVCAMAIPCFGGDYNDEPVSCRQKSIDVTTEALIRVVEGFPDFCKKNKICLT
jgi:acetylornithine deacetylase/succinyl-diaminopimelate desuccinylase-like protein